LGVQFNGNDEAVLQVDQYLVDHPGSPSAVRRPKAFREGDTFIVLLNLMKVESAPVLIVPSTTKNLFSAPVMGGR